MRPGELPRRFRRTVFMVYLGFGTSCLLLLVTTPAWADRFLERLLPRNFSSANAERSQIVSFYRSKAQAARKRNDVYLADHFARRAAHFLYYDQQIKLPNIFFSVMHEGASEALLTELSRTIEAALDCAAPKAKLRDKLELIGGFEEFSLKALQVKSGRFDLSIARRLSNMSAVMPKVSDCVRLGPVPGSEELDWNIPDGDGKIVTHDVPTVRLMGKKRPIYGRTLDGPHSKTSICHVYYSQRTIYFAIGSEKINAAPAEQEMRAVADSLTKYPDSIAVVEAHADEPGGRNFNLELGARRASSVRKYLSRELNTPNLQLVSLGANCPQRQGLGNIHVRENRRVTIKIVPTANLGLGSLDHGPKRNFESP
jgi:hypothetical protein